VIDLLKRSGSGLPPLYLLARVRCAQENTRSGSVSRSGTSWQYVIDAGLDAHGRRRQHRRRGFETKKAATSAMIEVLHGELVTDNRTTLAEFAERWLAAVRAGMEPAGYTNYRITLTPYAHPRLGTSSCPRSLR